MEFETYADVIDAYNADDMGYSSLTDYIRDQNIKIKEIQGFADEDHLFAKNTDYAYERLPKCHKYYDKRKLAIPSDISCELFTRPEYAVDYVKIVKKNINRWLNNIRKKENLNKEINF